MINKLGLIIRDDKVVVSSIKVSEIYDKRHDHILRDIRNIIQSIPEALSNFGESFYINEQNRKMPEYLMDRQGFSMLVMGFTGQKAKQFTYQYTKAFEEMANHINEKEIPQGKNLLALAVLEAQKIIEEKDKQIEQMQPALQFTLTVTSSKNSILVRELAKIASDKGLIIGEKRLYNKLREWGLIMKKSTEPMQRAVDAGYFEVVERVRESTKGTFIFKTTRVTGKGQIYIINRLIKETYICI